MNAQAMALVCKAGVPVTMVGHEPTALKLQLALQCCTAELMSAVAIPSATVCMSVRVYV